ncbi:hypothetical protein CAP35_06345 [Chitinophagaceae bacterium IBVUCB1]|nr:hypothetical protein CAP35_06345 [Chitinophagaceae bacterium IBVUCB1]
MNGCMRYLLLLIIFLLSVGSLQAQSTDTIEYYLKHNMQRCEPVFATYYRIGVREGQWWKVKDFYMDSKFKKSEGYYTKYENDSFSHKEGIHYTYYSNGKLHDKVTYVNNLKEGIFKAYDTTGRLKDSIFYKNDLPNKFGYGWYRDGTVRFKGVYDTAATGIGEEWEYHHNGKLSSYGKTSKGYLLDSIWTYYHENGNISSLETYLADSLKGIICYNEDGTVYENSDCKPVLFATAEYNVNHFISENIRYPKKAINRNIEGVVIVAFTVEVDGSIDNIHAIGRHIAGGCEEEAIRVIKLMPKWKPCKHHNRIVRMFFTQPVTFRLE